MTLSFGDFDEKINPCQKSTETPLASISKRMVLARPWC